MAKFNYDVEQELGAIARRGGKLAPMADPEWMAPRMSAFVEWLERENILESGTIPDLMMLAHNFHSIVLQLICGAEDGIEGMVYPSAALTFQFGCDDLVKRAAAKHDGPPR